MSAVGFALVTMVCYGFVDATYKRAALLDITPHRMLMT